MRAEKDILYSELYRTDTDSLDAVIEGLRETVGTPDEAGYRIQWEEDEDRDRVLVETEHLSITFYPGPKQGIQAYVTQRKSDETTEETLDDLDPTERELRSHLLHDYLPKQYEQDDYGPASD